jgi:hypothetical protein
LQRHADDIQPAREPVKRERAQLVRRGAEHGRVGARGRRQRLVLPGRTAARA